MMDLKTVGTGFVFTVVFLFLWFGVPDLKDRIPGLAEVPAWVPVLVIGLLWAGVSRLTRRRQIGRRRAETERFARDSGMEYQAALATFGDEWLEGLPLFRREKEGSLVNRAAARPDEFSNVLRGDDLLVFDYSYQTQGGEHTTTHEQTVAARRKPGRYLSSFELSSSVLFGKFDTNLGGGIHFDDDPEFSRHYLLRGVPPDHVRRIFGSGVRRTLLNERGWSVEGHMEWVIVYKPGVLMDPDHLPELIEASRRISGCFEGVPAEEVIR